MKKILFITDCSLKQCHSIRDILYSLLNHDTIITLILENLP